MKKILSFAAVLFFAFNFNQSNADELKAKCPREKPLKVAVFEGGPYITYQNSFRQMLIALVKKGYVNAQAMPSENFNFDDLDNWDSLAKKSKGGCIEFQPTGLYNLGWDLQKRDETKKKLKKRVQITGDIDLLIAYGTIGGVDYADSSFGIPIMVAAISTPETSDIVMPGNFSSKPNVHVQKEVRRYESEMTMFHEIFNFKTMGIPLDNDIDIQRAQAYFVAKKVANRHGFKLVECYGNMQTPNVEENYREYGRCLKELSTKAEAVYLTNSAGMHPTNLKQQIAPLIANKIPTFSQLGDISVQQGALLSLADIFKIEAGAFEADVLIKILQGQKPETIPQYNYPPLFLTFNLKTANAIEWKPSFEVLVSVDMIHQSVQ